MVIPTSTSTFDMGMGMGNTLLGEALGEALVTLAKWALDGGEGRGGEEDKTIPGAGRGGEQDDDDDNHNTAAADSDSGDEPDDDDELLILFTPDDSDSEDYSALSLSCESAATPMTNRDSTGTTTTTTTTTTTSADSAARHMNPFTTEGVAVAKRIWTHFWSPEYMHFRTERRTAETIGDWNGYTCWAYLIGLEALLEAEKCSPGTFRAELRDALLGLEKFWSPDHSAYCAWVWFPGNGDIYIDDNAQVAILLLLAHRVLPPPPPPAGGRPYATYLERAAQVVEFCLRGWDAANGGGVRWHVSTEGPPWTNRNACSTSLTGVAALELAGALREGGAPNGGERVRRLVGWGRRCVDWVWGELVEGRSPGGLVVDGLVQRQKGGEWVVDGTTYTYNTGHTITALVLLYDLLLPGDPHAPTVSHRLTTLITSSLDRTKPLYDTTVPAPQHRHWWDTTFFTHLLVEGLVLWGTRFGPHHPALWAQARAELTREMTYLVTQLRDGDDGLYWRNWRLYTVSMGHLAVYKSLTGDVGREPELDGAERMQDGESLGRKVGQRGMVKTLLGCGGAGRALCIAGRVLD